MWQIVFIRGVFFGVFAYLLATTLVKGVLGSLNSERVAVCCVASHLELMLMIIVLVNVYSAHRNFWMYLSFKFIERAKKENS